MIVDSVVTWKWEPPRGYRSKYGAEQVNALFRGVRRHYPRPFRAICITDQSQGIDPSIEVIPAWNDFAELPPPQGMKNPSCYRRLRLFHPDIGQILGNRIVSVDLDMLFTGSLIPVWERCEDVVFVGDTNRNTHYNGSMVLLKAGTRAKVWTEFNPQKSPKMAVRSGAFGSDQAWISYCLGPGEATWTKKDGVYSFRNHIATNKHLLPSDARVVSFHGQFDPWHPKLSSVPWVQEHYAASAAS